MKPKLIATSHLLIEFNSDKSEWFSANGSHLVSVSDYYELIFSVMQYGSIIFVSMKQAVNHGRLDKSIVKL